VLDGKKFCDKQKRCLGCIPRAIIGWVENEIVGEENEIKRIDEGKRNSYIINGKKYEGKYGKKRMGLHYHGKGEHSTKFCKVIKP
jgi:hypothetical protein